MKLEELAGCQDTNALPHILFFGGRYRKPFFSFFSPVFLSALADYVRENISYMSAPRCVAIQWLVVPEVSGNVIWNTPMNSRDCTCNVLVIVVPHTRKTAQKMSTWDRRRRGWVAQFVLAAFTRKTSVLLC